ncbi:hypothetical protein KI688_010523 [Linnemannia hyalina]|uniref:Uncharacterized protein n=2 Tax=Linnemannia hyalina TaxID=64524 RepID=A0A9P7XY37_9FUNG|nr:hypothetical protein KI688_010523 [Linnemannia hyalina]
MAFKRISAVLCFALALSGVCNAAPRSQFTNSLEDWIARPYRLQKDSTVAMPQYRHPQGDTADDGIHVDTHELEITVIHPHQFMEMYGWIPHMDEDFREFRMLEDDNCVEFSIKIIKFKACKFERGITLDVSAFGIKANAIECADVHQGCSVNPIDSIAGKVGVNGICRNGKVNISANLCIGPKIFRKCANIPHVSIGISC